MATATADSAERAVVFAYEAGDAMPGLTAPARRVFFFASAGAARELTADGWRLFDAAVRWIVSP